MKPIVKKMWTCDRLRSYNDFRHAIGIWHVCPDKSFYDYCKGKKCRPITITIEEGHK